MLRGYGAEVVITPTAVDHDSPESYYSVSSRLAEEIPGGFKPDQYSNMSNPEAHYLTTGPEIFEQTGGEIDALVISVGTGGTISGVGRYFKEHAPHVQDRRRRSRGIGVHREERRRPAPVPRRGDRQGHVAGDDGSRRSSTSGSASRTATRSSPRGGSRARRGCSSAARPARRSPARSIYGAACEPGRAGADDPPRLRPVVPLEVPRRQLDDRARLPRARHAGAARARPAAREDRRDAGVRHRLVAPEGRRGDLGDGALLDLAAAGRARRRGGDARRRDRLAAGSRAARPRLQERRRAARGRRGRDARAAQRRSTRTRRSTRS